MTTPEVGSPLSDLVHVQVITITFDRSYKPSGTLEMCIDRESKVPVCISTQDEVIRWTFAHGIVISSTSLVTLQPQRRGLWPKNKGELVTIPAKDLVKFCSGQSGEKREWRGSYSKFTICIQVSLPEMPTRGVASGSGPGPNLVPSRHNSSADTELPSTTADILQFCPRFRILVIGKSGVGKSSLINKTFGVDKASVSHADAGKSDINTEIVSAQNELFVLHDSQGFEPGEVDNFNIVKKFIEQRKQMPELKDRLHAIWLCIQIPDAGGRIFETGEEEFIKLPLGHVPVMVVFTQFDKLVGSVFYRMTESRRKGLREQEILDLAKRDAEGDFKKICILPLKKFEKKKSLYVKVSVEEGYQHTLSDLVELTYRNVHKYVAEEASLVSAFAQRTGADPKIEASIIIGKKRYWAGLRSSVDFSGKSLKRCLDVIHTDIITVWNFRDTKTHLLSDEFKALMSNVVKDLADTNTGDPKPSLTTRLTSGVAVAVAVAPHFGPAAPIAISVIAGFALAQWVFDVYQQTHGTLRCLMGYIIDLTIIMQYAFWLAHGDTNPVSRRLLKLAVNSYFESATRADVHTKIRAYVDGTNVFNRTDRSNAFDKIVELIRRYHVSMQQIEEPKRKIGVMGRPDEDEPWDVSGSSSA